MHRTLPHRRVLLPPAAGIFIAIAGLAAGNGIPAAPAAETARTDDAPVGKFATWGSWAALGLPDGKIVFVDVSTSSRSEIRAPSGPILALAIVPGIPDAADGGQPAGAPDVVVAIPRSGGSGCRLLLLGGTTGDVRAQADLSFVPARLLSGPKGGVTCMITAGRPPRGKAPGAVPAPDGILQAIDLGSAEPKPIGIAAGGEITAEAITPQGDRVLLGLRDRIRSFATQPLRSSWILRSPGDNRAIVAFADGEILVARGRELALIDPSRLPGKDPNTGASPRDDARARLALPFEPHDVSVSLDGAEAAVLDGAGTKLALVDLKTWRIREIRSVPGAATAIFHPEKPSLFVFENDGDLVEIVYAEKPPPDEATAAAAPPSQPEPAAGQKADSEASSTRPPAPEPAAANTPPEPVPPGEEHAGAESPATPAGLSSQPSFEEEAETVKRPPVPSEPPAEPEPEPGPAVLSGKITGARELVRALVLYGPDSILHEHMRIPVGEDGTFSSPIPPAGRYRLVPVGAKGVQLNVKPPLRLVTVAGEGIDGLDFDVTGAIAGSIVR